MSTIKNYEELEVWKTSMDLVVEVYKLTNTTIFTKDFGLKDQVIRSAVSVPSNIAEGYERDTPKQFLHFLNIAKASCGELRTQIMIANRIGYLNSSDYLKIYGLCESTEKQLGGFRKYLQKFNT